MTEGEICTDHEKSIKTVNQRRFARPFLRQMDIKLVSFLLFGIFGYHPSHVQVSSREFCLNDR